VVHCCAPDIPIALLAEAGADALSLDASSLSSSSYDALGEVLDAGHSLWLGLLPGTDAEVSLDTARTPLRRLWADLGFAPNRLAESVVPTPACGLAGASPRYVRRVLSLLRDVGRSLQDET
jgi:hypothetical protein